MTTELNTEKTKDALVNGIMIAASDANDLVKEKLEAAGSSLVEARKLLAEKARTAATTSSDYMKDHPWKVIGLAAAAGIIVGILTWRR